MTKSKKILCAHYRQDLEEKLSLLHDLLFDFDSRIPDDSEDVSEFLDYSANYLDTILQDNMNLMWRRVKGTVPWKDLPLHPEIEKMTLLGATTSSYVTNSTASQLLYYMEDLQEDLPDYTVESDGDENVIINWLLDGKSCEWTVTKFDVPWPMIKVYEYVCSEGKDVRPLIKVWHNVGALGESFLEIVSNE